MKLYRRGKIWWVSQWDNTLEKQIRLSTGEEDKTRATTKALGLLAPLLTNRDADLVETAANTVQKLRKQSARETAGRIPLAECWDMSPKTTSAKGRTLKDNTVADYKRCWDCFVRFAAAKKVFTANEVTKELIAEYFQQLGPRSQVVCFDLGKGIFARLGIAPSPWQKRPGRNSPVTHREPLSMEQVKALLQRVDQLAAQKNSAEDAGEFAVFVRFLLYTGLRLGDAATFPADHYDESKGTLSRIMAKTGKMVTFPVHPDMVARLTAQVIHPENAYLFPSIAAQYFRRRDVLSKRFRRLFDSVEVKGEPHQYCAHALRTTFASICATQSVPLAVIQSWLGHDSPSITRIYARVEDMRQKRAAMAKFPTLG